MNRHKTIQARLQPDLHDLVQEYAELMTEANLSLAVRSLLRLGYSAWKHDWPVKQVPTTEELPFGVPPCEE